MNPEHADRLRRGVDQWNRWRRRYPGVQPDLSDVTTSQLERDLHAIEVAVVNEVAPGKAPTLGGPWDRANLTGVNLAGANLAGARLDGAILIEADLTHSDLTNASLSGCVLTGANLSASTGNGADLTAASLRWANMVDVTLEMASLRLANLDQAVATRAILRGADLFYASIVGADLEGADISGAHVYGLSAWDVNLTDTIQSDLVITKGSEAPIAVDDLEVAQFLYVLTQNRKVRAVIDTMATKLVLILGRFAPRRKRVLEAVRKQLRLRGYIPVLFDFERPASRDFTETVVTLAHLARFIVADLTEPASLPKELEAIIPTLAIPVQPILRAGDEPYAMFADYWKYDWVLPIQRYRGISDLARHFDAWVIDTAEVKARELTDRRTRALN